MVKRMLIDATHPEETRVVVVNGTRLEELDLETSTKRQLKGNIYLAKVVRVEPSLQAAFVDYGGNRHGFLAFSEIHPDYFQIPVADRKALLAAQNADHYRDSADGPDPEPAENGADSQPYHPEPAGAEAADVESHEEHSHETQSDDGEPRDGDAQEADTNGSNGDSNGDTAPPRASVDVIGGDEASEQELERRRARILRNYKIQEVIKRRQIMLVQVVKEERGNKGAALTTYLSLAGRYCVLMPNTARGGGVSRKIVNLVDRKRLKSIAQELEIPEGMAVIIRTAGSERSKTEIRRDYEYLLRAWDVVRELTLKSSAPALTYEEASLIKRSIRDLYSRDIDEVLVEGEEGYRLAKDYMRMLTPSHAKKVQPFRDVVPMFHRYQVDAQLDAMHSPVVQLKSGGYIVIAQTEALVAIDVNSGRATKERHIEETAVKTNLEAADEVARQMRLRDLAGLIVIDFIDMEESRNNHSVERRLKEALKNDRARIQVGRISAFGLLELSRQRLRPSLQETAFAPCTHCGGTGLVRSVESAAMHVLRAIEEEGIRRRSSEITVHVSTTIALYVLNQKREALSAIEERYQFTVYLSGDDTLIPPAYRMDRVKGEFRPEDIRPVALPAPVYDEDPEEDDVEDEDEETSTEGKQVEAASGEQADEAARKRRRRRRRKRRGDQPGDQPSQLDLATGETDEAPAGEGEDTEDDEEEGEGGSADGSQDGEGGDDRPRRRRRGRRGGRRRRRGGEDQPEITGNTAPILVSDVVADVFEAAEAAELAAAEARQAARAASASPAAESDGEPAVETTEDKPKRRRAPARKKAETEVEAEAEAETTGEEKPKRRRAPARKKAEADAPVEVIAEIEPPAPVEPVAEAEVAPPAPPPEPEEPPAPVGPPKRGWWNKLL